MQTRLPVSVSHLFSTRNIDERIGAFADRELTVCSSHFAMFTHFRGILIYSIVRYRERPNTPNPRQIHGNNTIEVMWTVAPSIFLFFVLGVTIYTMFGLSDLGGGNKLEVRVVAHQWWWEFDYPGYHIATADSLHIPANTIIQADLVSKDVIPGHNNQLLFKADSNAVGHTFPGACAEFCGAQHATCALM